MTLDLPFLKQLAPSMKRAMGVSLAALIIGGVIFVFGIRTEYAEIRKADDAIRAQNARMNQMRSDINNSDRQKQATQKARTQVDTLVAGGVIEPLLGSFAMRGKTLLDPIAQQTGFRIDSVRELPPLRLQLPKPAPEQLYYRQRVEFSGQGSYTQITAFIAQTEAEHPMAALSSLLVLGQPSTPETQKATILFEWPAKGEKAKSATLLKK